MAVTGINAQLGRDQFLQLLVAQLTHQDPLEPIKDQEFLAQLAQFSTLEGIQNLNTSFGDLMKLQQLTQGSSLIGKTVTFTGDDNKTVLSGLVSGLKVIDGKIQLQSGTNLIPLDHINAVA